MYCEKRTQTLQNRRVYYSHKTASASATDATAAVAARRLADWPSGLPLAAGAGASCRLLFNPAPSNLGR